MMITFTVPEENGKKVLTMAEYIDREALIAHIKDLPTWWADAGGVYGRSMKYPEGMFDCEDVISSVENAHPADVAPVVHGRWIYKGDSDMWVCSRCGRSVNADPDGIDLYCYHCGAKMDEKENDK